MDSLLYILALTVIRTLQALPLRIVARIGRIGGGAFYLLDGRHRRVAKRNLALCFPDKSAAEIRKIACENFKRIGENFCCAAKTASMSDEEVAKVIEVRGVEKFYRPEPGKKLESYVFAIGHFGNFEIYARGGIYTPGYRFATTYRGLRQASLNKLLQSLRERSGCLFFERRTDADALKAAMNEGTILLGLLSDQSGGDKGFRLNFFGRPCSTGAAAAVLALRYECPLFTSICYRTSLGRWRIEVGDEIPTHVDGQPRPAADIMQDVNDAFEAAVRKDPANWFWVHNRWKNPGRPPRVNEPVSRELPKA